MAVRSKAALASCWKCWPRWWPRADATVFGSAFLANPDLPERFRQRAALNAPDHNTGAGRGLVGAI